MQRGRASLAIDGLEEDRIRSAVHHPDNSAPEVVDLAKAAGFPTVTTGYVHSARYSAKKSGGTKTNASTKAKAKKVPAGVGHALKIQARAAAAAAKLASKGNVEVESAPAPAKRGPGRARKEQPAGALVKRGPGRPRKATTDDGATESLIAGGSLEHQFAALAVELGISRAEAILRRVREVLDRLTF